MKKQEEKENKSYNKVVIISLVFCIISLILLAVRIFAFKCPNNDITCDYYVLNTIISISSAGSFLIALTLLIIGKIHDQENEFLNTLMEIYLVIIVVLLVAILFIFPATSCVFDPASIFGCNNMHIE